MMETCVAGSALLCLRGQLGDVCSLLLALSEAGSKPETLFGLHSSPDLSPPTVNANLVPD